MFAGHDGQIGRFAWLMAWFALVIGQLHALARFQTGDGKSDLDSPVISAWADPAGDLLRPLLDWASPDTVYLTYGKLWLPVFVAFTLCAFVVRRRRVPTGIEKWAWRVALTGYVAACVSVVLEYWTQWGAMNDELLDTVFLATLPAMLLTMLGSSFLGVVLLVRRGIGLPAVLLALSVPGLFLIPAVTSLGNVSLPIAFAFGILGRRIARAQALAGDGEVVAASKVVAYEVTGRPADR
jgi:hypothetical protein